MGTFDGVHLGHAALLERARAVAHPGDRIVALAFDPHPLATLQPGTQPPRLTTFDDRVRLLKELGAADVQRLDPTPEFLSLSPEAFVDHLLDRYAPRAIVEGADFRFGRGRKGDIALLDSLGRRKGFRLVAVEPVTATLTDLTVVTASSTITRWLLLHGRVGDAARVLGREYAIRGVVERGDRRGRTIGYPTANIASPCLAPADGVYAGVATLPDSRAFLAAISVGSKPTFPGADLAVEAFLLDAPRDGPCIAGLPEYGWQIKLAFHSWIRDQVRFADVDSLVAQLDRDCTSTRQLLEAPACP